MESKNWQIVKQHHQAWINKDFSKVPYSSNVVFKGPIDQLNGVAEFTARVTQVSQMVTDIVVRDKSEEGDRISVVYDFVTKTPVGTMQIADFYWLKNGEITRIETYFDPRAILAFMEQVQKKMQTQN